MKKNNEQSDDGYAYFMMKAKGFFHFELHTSHLSTGRPDKHAPLPANIAAQAGHNTQTWVGAWALISSASVYRQR